MCKSNLLNNIGKTIKVPECSDSCSLQRCLIYKEPCSSEAGDSAGEAPLFRELGEYIFIFYAWAAEVKSITPLQESAQPCSGSGFHVPSGPPRAILGNIIHCDDSYGAFFPSLHEGHEECHRKVRV